MAIVAGVTLVLDVRRVDRDTTGLLFGGLVDFRIVGEARAALLGEDLGDGRRQGGLAMVDVTCGQNPDVDRNTGGEELHIPMVPMFKWGLARENFDDAGSAYPRAKTWDRAENSFTGTIDNTTHSNCAQLSCRLLLRA